MTVEQCLAILEIGERPTKLVVKRAFRRIALKTHPDTVGSDQAFQRAKLAYDTLMALSDDQLAKVDTPLRKERAKSHGPYDPFDDRDYDKRVFFTPENPATEGFERSLRAKGCRHCGGGGFTTKIMDPRLGYASKERRLCKCQWN